jgi:hypothetical protein
MLLLEIFGVGGGWLLLRVPRGLLSRDAALESRLVMLEEFVKDINPWAVRVQEGRFGLQWCQ